MHAKTLASRAISGICVLALALLLASCKLNPTYKVGGIVSDLAGTGLVLQNNGGDNLAISSNGPFTFSSSLKKKASYRVTVFTQPSGQTCTVANGTGTVSRNVTDVRVNCVASVASTHTVGGTVSGLTGAGLMLQNNGGNDLTISSDSAFTFATGLASGAVYSVTVRTQPSGQGCEVANGTGSMAGANVTNVAVQCAAAPAAPTLSLGFGVKELQFTWPAVSGANFYRLHENPDGVSGYTPVATNITALSYNHTIPVHRRLNARYILEACNIGGCTGSAEQILGTNLTQAIGYVKASNTGASDQFGYSVALSSDGNTLAIGANLEDSSTTVIDSTPNESAADAGAVYVFVRGAGIWSQQAYLKASNAGAGDNFGTSIALSGDGNTLAVGATNEASSTSGINTTPNELAGGAGAVYVFTRSGSTWSQQAYVKASNPVTFSWFGNSVALSSDGNTLAVGAALERSGTTGINNTPDESAFFAGAAYVFTRSGSAWSQQAYVKASNTEAFDMFGSAVALSGDGNTLAVGAPREDGDLNAASGSGAVYVYTRAAGTWSQQAYVKASNTGADDSFGNSVALSGDGNTLAVGAIGEASAATGIGGNQTDDCGIASPANCATASGAVYVFTLTANTWALQAYVKASNTGAGDQFGNSVALSGDGNTLAVGANLEDSSGSGIGSTPNEAIEDFGAVYFFTRNGSTWSQQTFVKASNPEYKDQFGVSVALSGDGNTLAVGAQLEDSTPNNSAADAGAVYLY